MANVYLRLEFWIISKQCDDGSFHTVNDLCESHECHFLIPLDALLLVLPAKHGQFVQFLVVEVTFARKLEETPKGAVIIGFAQKIVSEDLTGAVVHFLRLAELTPVLDFQVSFEILHHA